MAHANKALCFAITDVHAAHLSTINQSHQTGVWTSMQTTRSSLYHGTVEDIFQVSVTKLWSRRKHAGELEKAYQMPLASGQSLAIKAHVNNGETGLSNKKWSYRRER